MSEHGVPVPTEMQRSSRDPAVLQDQLEKWLAGRLPSGASPAITAIAATSATGLSSDTILLTAEWDDGSDRTARDLVARIAPDVADVPVFPSYDLERQFRVIGDVGRLSAVPVPDLYWSEHDTRHVGAPFFVMGRVEGVVPPDLMPYTFGDNWLYDASPADQRGCSRRRSTVLAELHGIEQVPDRFGYLAFDEDGELRPAPPRRPHPRLVRVGGAGTGPSPVIERGLRLARRRTGPTTRATPSSAGAIPGSATSCTATSSRSPCSTGRWPASVPASSTSRGSCTATACSRTSPRSMALPGHAATSCASTTSLAEYERLSGYTPRDLDFYVTYAARAVGDRVPAHRSPLGALRRAARCPTTSTS